MNTPYLIQTIIEVLLGGTIIIGFIYEPTLAEWEQSIVKTIKDKFASYRGN